MTDSTLGLRCGRLTGTIWASNLDTSRVTATARKQDVTGQALAAVADWSAFHHQGSSDLVLPDGRRLRIQVVRP